MTEYEVIKTKRKTLCIKVEKDASVTVRAPFKATSGEIEAFVLRHVIWIEEKVKQQKKLNLQKTKLTAMQADQLKSSAKDDLIARVTFWEDVMGVKSSGVKITSAVTRWGSCNSKNSLCFSYKVMLLPTELRDLIVVHELCHIRHKNHQRGFYAQLEEILPDCKVRQKQLKECSKTI